MAEPTQAQINAKIQEWNAWYQTLPTDLRARLSIHDFKRLGDNFYRIFVLTAAAQAGEDNTHAYMRGYVDGGTETKAATIERCAQVAETAEVRRPGFAIRPATPQEIAAAIRALKDKT
jgi:hypothetical protein